MNSPHTELTPLCANASSLLETSPWSSCFTEKINTVPQSNTTVLMFHSQWQRWCGNQSLHTQAGTPGQGSPTSSASPGDGLKHTWAPSRTFGFREPGRGLIMCISVKLPQDVGSAGPRTPPHKALQQALQTPMPGGAGWVGYLTRRAGGLGWLQTRPGLVRTAAAHQHRTALCRDVGPVFPDLLFSQEKP